MFYTTFLTPLGWIGLAGSKKGLRLLALPRSSLEDAQQEVSGDGAIADKSLFGDLERKLRLYLAGKHVLFDDLELDLSGAPDFHRRVWRETRAIPYGQTRSYHWLAERAGSPRASRAVGNAMAANPLPIIIPCHRVITSHGRLGGFGGGPDLKRYLLDMEQSGIRRTGRTYFVSET